MRSLPILLVLAAFGAHAAPAAPECRDDEDALGRLARDLRSAAELDLGRARKPVRAEPDGRSDVKRWIGIELDDDTLVEGSWSVGGKQPDFWIDWEDPALKRDVLDPVRKIAADEPDIWKRIAKIQAVVNRTLPRNGYKDRAYIRYNKSVLAKDDHIASLGEYVALGAGVCRENALVTTVALRAAGIDARFGYFLARARGEVLGDHAIALVEIDGTTWIVDSFKPFGSVLNGHKLAELLDPPRRGRFTGSPLSVNNDELPVGYSLTPNDFPLVRSGDYR